MEKKAANSLEQINKQTIRAVKRSLKEVSVKKVWTRLGLTQQGLSYHLKTMERNPEKANVAILEKIVNAIAAEKKILEERALRVQKKAENIAA